MSEHQSISENRGGQPPIISAFGIRGLFGYKTVSLETDYATCILIAKNGSGKTTLLGAMNAFLRTNFTRLRGLHFTEIFCRLHGYDEEFTISHSDLKGFLEVPSEGEIVRLARQTEKDIATIFTFLVEEWPIHRTDYSAWHEHPVLTPLFRSVDYNHTDMLAQLDHLRASLFNRSEKLKRLHDVLREVLDGIEIVYLPTYRRVELALSEEKEGRIAAKSRPQKLLRTSPTSLHQADIQFGLTDISDRLSQMNQQIVVQSNAGYREVTANIINELIEGRAQLSGRPGSIPNKEELNLFFSRIADSASYFRHTGFPVVVPNIDKIYSGTLEGPEALFLFYFLGKIDTTIKATHNIELQVEEFINRCNGYLAFAEVSGDAELRIPDPDAKKLQLNKSDLRVHVESLASGTRMKLDTLSSGEKQMVSMFGKLYLYPQKKIVLIDEPELSLSIDWQRKILVDVVEAPVCQQLIAITHSPFIFDNALLPFSKSLRMSIAPTVAQSQSTNKFEVDLE